MRDIEIANYVAIVGLILGIPCLLLLPPLGIALVCVCAGALHGTRRVDQGRRS